MRSLLFAMVIFPQFANCQLSDDSLRKLCVKKYEEDFPIGKSIYWRDQLNKGNISEKVEELFERYFSDFRIFLVDYDKNKIDLSGFYHGGPEGYPKIYAFNVLTGLPVSLRTDTIFFSIINTSNKKITNLDICYLYLFLNRLESTGIANPERYREALRSNSIFSKHPEIFTNVRPHNCNSENIGSASDDINNSDRWNIKLPVVKVKDNIEFTYRYTFVFEKRGVLNRINVELLRKRRYTPCVND